jgi:hypothetical protein
MHEAAAVSRTLLGDAVPAAASAAPPKRRGKASATLAAAAQQFAPPMPAPALAASGPGGSAATPQFAAAQAAVAAASLAASQRYAAYLKARQEPPHSTGLPKDVTAQIERLPFDSMVVDVLTLPIRGRQVKPNFLGLSHEWGGLFE